MGEEGVNGEPNTLSSWRELCECGAFVEEDFAEVSRVGCMVGPITVSNHHRPFVRPLFFAGIFRYIDLSVSIVLFMCFLGVLCFRFLSF